MANRDPNIVRADAIRRDIYNRHGLPEDTDPAEALGKLLAMAEDDGMGQQGAWANPTQRRVAETKYATTRGFGNAQDRLGHLPYLMDPQTAEFHTKYGRDGAFLAALAADPDALAPPAYMADSPYTGASLGQALDRWDRSHAPLYATGVFSGNTLDADTIPATVMDLFGNVEYPLGQFFQWGEVGPVGNTGRFLTSGESGGYGESFRNAYDSQRFEDRYRLRNKLRMSPTLDMPTDASPVQVRSRLEHIDNLAATGAAPDGAHQLTRHASPFVRDFVDGVYSWPDATFFLSALTGGGPGAAKSAVRSAASQAAETAGRRSLLSGLSKAARHPLAKDAYTEAAFTTGINAAVDTSGRTFPQYVFGDGKSEPERTPEDAKAGREARAEMRSLLEADAKRGPGAFSGVRPPRGRVYSQSFQGGR